MKLEINYSILCDIVNLMLICQNISVSFSHSSGCGAPQNEGFISSHVTDETGCGSTRSPWVIAAMPGQTIELSIIDFGSELLKQHGNHTVESPPPPVYGYITDGEKRLSFVGGAVRERSLYQSQSHQLSVEIAPAPNSGFLLQYKSRLTFAFVSQ